MNQLYVFTLIILLLVLVIILYFLNQTSMALILIFAVLILAIVGWCHTERGIPWSDKLSMMYKRMTDSKTSGPPRPAAGGVGGVIGAGSFSDAASAVPSSSPLLSMPLFSMGGSAALPPPPSPPSLFPSSLPDASSDESSRLGGEQTPILNFAPTPPTDQSVRFTWLPQLPSFNVFSQRT